MKAQCKKKQNSIFIIDGFDGTGKSNLSYRIGYETLGTVLNLDNFLIPGVGKYVAGLDFIRLSARISILKSAEKPFIIEGCCILELLNLLKVDYDCLIYCKGISEGTRIWHDGDSWVYPDFPQTSLLNQTASNLELEIHAYHDKYRPWEKANFIFNLINQNKRKF